MTLNAKSWFDKEKKSICTTISPLNWLFPVRESLAFLFDRRLKDLSWTANFSDFLRLPCSPPPPNFKRLQAPCIYHALVINAVTADNAHT